MFKACRPAVVTSHISHIHILYDSFLVNILATDHILQITFFSFEICGSCVVKQWQKVRAYKPAKVNLNWNVLVNLVHIHCPSIGPSNENEMADAAARHAAAVNMFTRLCPVAASVQEVIGIRRKGRKKCLWRVRYARNLNTGYLQMDGEQLVRDIMNNKPSNTEIIEKMRCPYPPFIELTYACGCSCNSKYAN